jgi:hypothetical protein
MRSLPYVVAAVVLIAATTMSHAQSAYDYPWCAFYARTSGATSCYFQSYQQCMTTLSGIGGFCARSPYYRGPAPRNGHTPD